MDSGHLQEHDLDLLLDDELGSDTAALRSHLEGCSDCRAELQSAREAIALLERLPHRAPSPDFSSRVMSEVRVFEPLPVTIVESIRQLVPSGGKVRSLALAAAAVVGFMLSSLTVLALTRVDSLLFVGNLMAERSRIVVAGAVQGTASGLIGERTSAALGLSGAEGLWFLAALLVSSTLISAIGLKFLASAARRGRS